MTKLGYPSKVTEAWVKGKAWFRVQHGEYKMIAVAKQVSTKLKNKYKFKSEKTIPTEFHALSDGKVSFARL